MKKKKLTRKERKQLRDEELAKRGIDPDARRQPPKVLKGQAVWASMFQSGKSKQVQEAFLEAVIMSEDLADEPEMEEVFFDPIKTIDALIEEAQRVGIRDMDDDLPEDVQIEVQDRVVKKLLTRQMQRQIKDAVDRLVDRLEKTGDKQKLPSASAIQIFTKSLKANEKDGWTGIGLVQELVRRSIEAGVELIDFVEQETSDNKDINEILQSMDEKKAKSIFESITRKIPGLRSLLEKEVDAVWEEGMEAIESGDLDLELFSPEELMGGINVVTEELYSKPAGEIIDEDMPRPDLTEDQAKKLLAHLEKYITGLFVPERLDQMRAQLGSYMNAPGDRREYIPFIGLLHSYMLEDNAVENEMPFLVRTLFMELRNCETSQTETLASDK
ncbi:MAG: hypothetical protein JXB30_02930 [Anaerolineae bacterium]|nr:hypothetical protein [Anaerolineae bacterium]